MNIYDATEQAYKNGYEAGKRDAAKDHPEDEVYCLTPKGCATVALLDAGLTTDIDDKRIEVFWVLFEHYMQKNNYVTNE